MENWSPSRLCSGFTRPPKPCAMFPNHFQGLCRPFLWFVFLRGGALNQCPPCLRELGADGMLTHAWGLSELRMTRPGVGQHLGQGFSSSATSSMELQRAHRFSIHTWTSRLLLQYINKNKIKCILIHSCLTWYVMLKYFDIYHAGLALYSSSRPFKCTLWLYPK